MSHFKGVYLILFITLPACLQAQYPIKYEVTASATAGGGKFNPYYLVSNRHGIMSVEPNSGYLRGSIEKQTEKYSRFSYGFGLDLATAYRNNSTFWIQQLYAEIKYRCLLLTVGSKEYNGTMKNHLLSSGSMVWSGNARPIPEIRLSIPEFVAVPFTNSWLQIKGDISYGFFTDNSFLKNNFDHPNSFVCTDVLYHQKKIFFRSKENQPFIVTLGAELAAQFGGKRTVYIDGVPHYEKDKVTFLDFFNILIPGKGAKHTSVTDKAYYYGNHLGAWHGIFEYKFKNKSRVKGYFEWFFEDGSGMGKLNGWDGLWGIEYNSGNANLLSGLVIEYLQTTNQSGPIHWNPNDAYWTQLTEVQATGADDYYNNACYNGWAHYGMSAGTPLLKSPVYNKDGYLRFTDNRVKALHIGINGYFTTQWNYRILASYRKSWGTPFIPVSIPKNATSALLEITYTPQKWEGWSFCGAFSIDHGSLYGNNTAAAVSVRKTGFIFNR